MTFCNKRSVDQQNSTLDINDKQFFLKFLWDVKENC